MEGISKKDRDQTGRMRPGSIFTSSRDDGLRYVDKDGIEAWTTPNSRYYASERILRGQAVSIAQLKDLNTTTGRYPDFENVDAQTMAEDKYPYVKITDPDLDDHCLGVALNYAEPGDIVHVQNHGKFSYYTTKSSFYTSPDSRRKGKEVFLNADKEGEWNISNVRGQAVYIKKVVEDPDSWETGHDTEDEIQSTDDKNNFTYDLDDSIYNTKNTIQLGYLVDAPTEEALDEDQIVTFELNVTGDTRGPIDNTSFLMKLGEDVYFDYNLKHVTYKKDDIDCNEGIFDELKVVALNGEDPHEAAFTFFTRTQVLKTDLGDDVPKNAFIAVRKLDGPTIFTPIFNPLDFDGMIIANDKGYVSLSKAFAGNIDETFPAITELEGITDNIPSINQYYYLDNNKHILIANDPIETINVATISDAIKNSLDILTYTAVEASKNKSDPIEWKESKAINVGNDGKLVKAGINDGYYDVYVSKELLQYISIKQRKHGQSAPKGTAVLADVRDGSRLNVVGVVVSNQPGIHRKGETIRVMKMGRITTKGELLVGKQFYLGLNGRITIRQQYWYDYNVPIGIAESNHYLIVDCHLPLKDYDGSFPLGFIKPATYGAAEKGFLLMDGYTVYNKKDWPELYESLKQWYGEDKLKPSNRDLEAASLIKELRQGFLDTTGTIIEDFVVTSVKDRVDTIETNVNTLEENFKAHENVHTLTDTDIVQRFESNEDTIQKVDENLRSKIDKDIEDVKDYTYEADKEIYENLNKETTELKEQQAALKNKIVSIEKDVEDNTDRSKEAFTASENNKAAIENLTQKAVDHETALDGLKDSQEEQDSKISALEDTLHNQDVKIDTIKENFSEDIQKLKDNLVDLGDSIETLKIQDLKLLEDTIKTLQDNVSNYETTNNTTVEELQEKLEEVKKQIEDIIDHLNNCHCTDSGDSNNDDIED